MPAWRIGLVGATLFCGALLGHGAVAQEMNGVNGGLNSDNGAMSGATINRVNGINANGTPRQQDPGASITNGAGNSTMTPGVTGPIGGNSGLSSPKTVPPTVILHNRKARSRTRVSNTSSLSSIFPSILSVSFTTCPLPNR